MIDWYLRYIERLLSYCDINVTPRKFLFFDAWLSILGSLFPVLLFYKDTGLAATSFATAFMTINIALFGFLILVKNRRADAAEEALPDYLLLFSNNIKAGFTPEQAMIVSAKKEIGILSVEVTRAVQGSSAGMPIEEILPKISERLDSTLVHNTFSLIVEGMLSGGDLSKLLERTSYDQRKFESVRKEVRSMVMVYELFIASAACLAAPLLLSTSLFIVKVVVSIRSKIPTGSVVMGSAFGFQTGAIELNDTTLLLFGFGALFVICLFASLAVGLINKGRQVEGLKYVPVLFAIASTTFLIVRVILELWLGSTFRMTTV